MSKIADFFKLCPYHKPRFLKAVAEGKNLGELRMLLLGMGCEVKSPKTLRAYLKSLDPSILEQREHERSLKAKTKRKLRRIPQFFIPKKNMLSETEDCKHERTESFFDLGSEKVYTKCKSCGQILGKGLTPEQFDKKLDTKWRKLASVWR